MIGTKTTFILGAGASRELGFPLGLELARGLHHDLNFLYRNGERISGHEPLLRCLQHHAQKSGTPLARYVQAAQILSQAMISATSIDDAINTHSHDEFVPIVGKLAISYAILVAESRSRLATGKTGGEPDMLKLSDTWYHRFSSLVFEGASKNDLERLFEKTVVVNFNYDRSLLQYLRLALVKRFSIELSEVEELLTRLLIHCPYGNLGSLTGADGVGFGSDPIPTLVVQIATGIQTFHEQIQAAVHINAIRNQLCETSRIVFLGFGFHPQNMKMLAPGSHDDVRTEQIYGTAKGFSPANKDHVSGQLRRHLERYRGSEFSERIVIEDLSCSQLLENYHYPLSA